ncbi:putative disease resistance protein RGA3 [Phragmites australis]|uniref:putative disease resistance protein RGA3 n=1 Tax=Phragmites australis TaxID=29695 RepID=UPI002D77ADD5|nr:putative disease resistance protein RGA3 [Phragmites australis]
MPTPAAAPWPVSQDLAALADRARSLSLARAGAELGALAAALLRIQPVARELERRGLQPGGAEGSDLHAWLVQLRDAVADAEDLLDELHRRCLVSPALSACVGAAFRNPARKLRRLVERLDRVHDDSERLLPVRVAAGCGVRSPNRVTGSVLVERKLFGREKECDEIAGRLLGDCGGKCSSSAKVVAVVGHGGMGKTTVAQYVYNDARIEGYFDLRAWVCVWDRSDEAELTREILQSIGGSDDTLYDDGLASLERLQERLEELVATKRFLLVLDDIWVDEEKTEHENRGMWNKVLGPLKSAACGSKILVTTRMRLVAEVLNATHVVPLDGLGISDCWLLLMKAALGGATMDTPPDLQGIGRAIAAKLKGSPLAAKAIGQMLRNTRSPQKWRTMLDTEICDSIIIPSLQLSYQHLPGHLQRCFAYCSIFSTTWRFDRYKLVNIWIALGFIQRPTTEEKRVEDLGQEYFDDLLSRSFFQTANKGQQTYYFLDDLMYDLARHFSAHDCMKIDEGVPVVIPHTVRHLSVSTDYLPQLKRKYRLGRLRTLLVLRSSSLSSSHFPSKLLAEFKNLRVLDLTESDIAELPETISQLVHLHYLALCCITNKLPKYIYKLRYLEVQDMHVLLFHDNHPRGIGKICYP